jgi:hypothetical protein
MKNIKTISKLLLHTRRRQTSLVLAYVNTSVISGVSQCCEHALHVTTKKKALLRNMITILQIKLSVCWLILIV